MAGETRVEGVTSVSQRAFVSARKCGFSSTIDGNTLTIDEELEKLRLVVETAREVWGDAWPGSVNRPTQAGMPVPLALETLEGICGTAIPGCVLQV